MSATSTELTTLSTKEVSSNFSSFCFTVTSLSMTLDRYISPARLPSLEPNMSPTMAFLNPVSLGVFADNGLAALGVCNLIAASSTLFFLEGVA